MAVILLCRGKSKVAASGESTHGHEFRVRAPALAGVCVQKAGYGVDVVDCGGEAVRGRIAVCCGDDDCAGGAGEEVAECRVVFGDTACEAAAVDVEVQGAESSGAGGAGLGFAFEDEDAECVSCVDGDVFDFKRTGEEPGEGADGVGYECDGLEKDEHAQAVGEGDVASKERVKGWTEPAPECPDYGSHGRLLYLGYIEIKEQRDRFFVHE